MINSDPGADAQRVNAVDVMDALHDVFTRHGIASRSDYPIRLIGDLVRWAAAMCRQSQPIALDARRVTEQNDEQAQAIQSEGATDTVTAGTSPRTMASGDGAQRLSTDRPVDLLGADARRVNAGDILKWAAELVRAVADPALARDLDAEVAEPVRLIALQMRDAAYAIQDVRRVAPVRDMGDATEDGDRICEWCNQQVPRRHRCPNDPTGEAQRIPAPPDAPQEYPGASCASEAPK